MMVAKPRSRWQKIGKRVTVIIIITACISVIVLTIILTWLNGTGFDGYDKVSIIRVMSGPTAGTVTKTEEHQPGKTLWDTLQLLGVIAIPIVVGMGAAWYSAQHNHEYEIAQLQHQNEQEAAEERAKTEREITQDNQREVLVQAYLDKMSELLLHENLRQSQPEDEVRKIARVLTIVVLPGLDRRRKGNVLQFLYEAGLLDKDKPIISLRGADLNEANLVEANLVEANLSDANLMGADFTLARLDGANLAGANLRKANFFVANLNGADLRHALLIEPNQFETASLEGAIMPDGSKHP